MSEIAVDINAPEPPSKKALRKAKKAQQDPSARDIQNSSTYTTKALPKKQINGFAHPAEALLQGIRANRSTHGIWIGNLAWSVTQEELKKFFVDTAGIAEKEITRMHMPAPSAATASQQRFKSSNKGFAYVDFTNQTAVKKAIGASESLVRGRKVLIKDKESYEGRPKAESKSVGNGVTPAAEKPKSRKIFVGNLGFEVTESVIQDHFAKCGQIEKVFLASFEDTGKCKGYGWIEFENEDDAAKAVRGWVDWNDEDDEEEEEEEATDQKVLTASSEEKNGEDDESDSGMENVVDSKKEKKKEKKSKKKTRKWWVNRLQGRELRMEFAEDSTTRYKKRFGNSTDVGREPNYDAPYGNSKLDWKDQRSTKDTDKKQEVENSPEATTAEKKAEYKAPLKDSKPYSRERKNINPFERRKVDARTIKPGAALSRAPRASGAIVEGRGKKTTFG